MADIIEATLAASAARTATASFEAGASLTRGFPQIIEVCIVSTALTLTPSVVPTIEVYNHLSGTWQTVLTGAAVTTNSHSVILRVGPNVASVTNLAAQAIPGPRWRVTMTASDTDSLTYSILGRVYRE